MSTTPTKAAGSGQAGFLRLRRAFATVGGRAAHYRYGGLGPPLLLLHEAPGSSAALAGLLGRLCPRLTVLAPDLPGCGLSDPIGDADVHGYADAIEQLLDGIGWPPSAVAGTGAGAAVARALAAGNPRRYPAVVVTRQRAAAAPSPPPALTPALSGAHVVEAWYTVRSGYLYRPDGTRYPGGVPDPATLHEQAVELMSRPAAWRALASLAPHAAGQDGLVDLGDEHPDCPAVAGKLITLCASAGTSTGGFRPAMPSTAVRSGGQDRYVDTSFGQVHVQQHDGDGTPVVVCHQSPSSARQLGPLISELAASRPVIAPDTPGQGRSGAPSAPVASIADCAEALRQVMDALGVPRADLFGTHTGALIALDLAVRHPDRVRCLVMDGVTLFGPAEQADLVARYTADAPLRPDEHGRHLLRIWNIRMDMGLFFPWYKRSAETSLIRPRPDPVAVHSAFLDIAANTDTWHLAYRAAFAYHTAAALSRLSVPALIATAADDPLRPFSAAARQINPAIVTGEHEGLASPQAQRRTARWLLEFFRTGGRA